MEEFTEEDWRIMNAVEACTVWQTLWGFRKPDRVKLLVFIALSFQETVETEGKAQQYVGWVRRWGEDGPTARTTLDDLNNNIKTQITGITASSNLLGSQESDSTRKRGEVRSLQPLGRRGAIAHQRVLWLKGRKIPTSRGGQRR